MFGIPKGHSYPVTPVASFVKEPMGFWLETHGKVVYKCMHALGFFCYGAKTPKMHIIILTYAGWL